MDTISESTYRQHKITLIVNLLHFNSVTLAQA